MDAPVLRAVPWVGGRWRPVACRLSGVLLDLAEFHPAFRPALRAWDRLSGPIRVAQDAPPLTPLCPPLALVRVDAADVAAFGAPAARLGACLLPGGDGGLAMVLAYAACQVGCTARAFVVELTCVHGVLDLSPGRHGIVLQTCTGALAVAAHRCLAGQVYAMWCAGDGTGEDAAADAIRP